MAELNLEKSKTINQALHVLNEAAKDSSDEIRTMITKDYQKIKEALGEVKPEILRAVRELREASEEMIVKTKDKIIDTTHQAANRVDRSAHDNPWYFVGATAAVAGIFGFMLGRKSV